MSLTYEFITEVERKIWWAYQREKVGLVRELDFKEEDKVKESSVGPVEKWYDWIKYEEGQGNWIAALAFDQILSGKSKTWKWRNSGK